MTDVDKTSTAHRLTVPTPNGPFTVIHLDGAVLASGWLLLGGGSKSIWPIFASSKQLLAALTLLGCSLWL